MDTLTVEKRIDAGGAEGIECKARARRLARGANDGESREPRRTRPDVRVIDTFDLHHRIFFTRFAYTEIVKNAGVTSVKNITLSADEELLAAARRRATSERTTLNEQFRQWLRAYARQERQAEAAMETISMLRESLSTGGRRFSRDEMNER